MCARDTNMNKTREQLLREHTYMHTLSHKTKHLLQI